ncbi:MAG TPA: Gfo/Idh/MocA family oxidoreductase [Stellaceae bacterium]|nr:Gfo/Idh/MocA family oxidoreductase [Stellaceae bacterium]
MTHGIGILGLGIMGERMLRNMAEHPAFDVIAAWDPDPAAAEKLRRLPGRARFADRAADAIADPDVACVYIATPPASHLGYADLAFDAGRPVFCEKPLSSDLHLSRAAVARVEREQRIAAINFPFASAPAVRAIAGGLKSGELGPIERVDIEVAFDRWPRTWQNAARWLAWRSEGGFVREVVSHFLFLTMRLLGPLAIRDCRVDFPDDGRSAETAIAAHLTAGTIPVTLVGKVGGDRPDHNRWILTGREGAFELHDWYSLKRRINGGWLDVDFGEGSIRKISYMAQLDSLDAMLHRRPHPLPSFREGLNVQECVEALLSRS